jgi:hypothetical protein
MRDARHRSAAEADAAGPDFALLDGILLVARGARQAHAVHVERVAGIEHVAPGHVDPLDAERGTASGLRRVVRPGGAARFAQMLRELVGRAREDDLAAPRREPSRLEQEPHIDVDGIEVGPEPLGLSRADLDAPELDREEPRPHPPDLDGHTAAGERLLSARSHQRTEPQKAEQCEKEARPDCEFLATRHPEWNLNAEAADLPPHARCKEAARDGVCHGTASSATTSTVRRLEAFFLHESVVPSSPSMDSND